MYVFLNFDYLLEILRTIPRPGGRKVVPETVCVFRLRFGTRPTKSAQKKIQKGGREA